jgi:hypothetical protein
MALVSIIYFNSAWIFRDISTTAVAMIDNAAATMARSQADYPLVSGTPAGEADDLWSGVAKVRRRGVRRFTARSGFV